MGCNGKTKVTIFVGMKIPETIIKLLFILVLGVVLMLFNSFWISPTEDCYSYLINPKTAAFAFYWKDSKGNKIQTFQQLKNHLSNKHNKLLFAMNGGMFQQDYSPLGLYIENGKVLHPLNLKKGTGNFYMEPNGIFYLDKSKKAHVVCSSDFVLTDSILYATQSGPMLLVNGVINSKFTQGSKNLYIRNGVGIKPDGTLLFAISKTQVNFYDFATYFKSKGCTNALYLDGYVSRMYCPEQGVEQMDGRFGVLIGVYE